MSGPRRGELWSTDAGVTVLVVSSTVYNEIRSEPTVVVVPVFTSEPDTGFGVDLGEGWRRPVWSRVCGRRGSPGSSVRSRSSG